MNKKLLLLILFFTILSSVYGQNRILTGILVSDDGNEPLIGASVTIPLVSKDKTAPVGVVTDIDGKFKITVPEGASNYFVCSYLGFTTQNVTLVQGKDHYRVVMASSSHTLGDVVVTGYQVVERRKLTAAISTVSISDETVGAVNSIDQALSGQIAGLSSVSLSGSPTAPMKIRIRGTASLSGTQDPLWVLDGIPLEGTDIPKMENGYDIDNMRQSSIAGLSPSDIETITVLKDVAATAIYGARAANGVIVITTKKGKVGKPRVNFTTKLTYSPTMSADRLNLMNASEKVGVELDMLSMQTNLLNMEAKGGVYNIISKHGLIDSYKNNGWNALTPQAQSEINALKGINTDWNDILFRSTLNQEYNVNISGGGDKVTYYNSFGYSKQQGNVQGVESDRFNLVSKTFYQMNKVVKTGVSIFANRRKNRNYLTDKYGLINPLFYSRAASPYMTPYDENGNYVYDFDIQNEERPEVKFNILEERENTLNDEKITSLSAIWDLEFRINEQIKLTSQLGVQMDKTSKEQIADEDTFTMRYVRMEGRYSSGGKELNFVPDGGFQKMYENDNSQVTWKGMGEYRNTFNNIHEFEIMLGSEIRKTWYNTLFSAGYGFDRATLTTKPIIFPDESRAEKFVQHSTTKRINAYASFFSTASYSLLQRYVLGGSIRFDGSDLFGVDEKYRYLPLYSFSGMWRASNEEFMKEQTWLDNLAIRASYGLQGNIDRDTSPYLLGTYKNQSILPGGSEQVIEVSKAPNDKLRWEKTASTNLGLDFSVLNQAINLSVDYYYRKGSDLIAMQMLPLETGFYSRSINWAGMVNKGVEVSLSTRNLTTKKFSWYTHFNFAYNNNKVLQEKVAENAPMPSREGYPVGAIFALKTAGLDNEGYPLFEAKDGTIKTLKELYRLKDPGWGIPMASSDVTTQEERDMYTYMGTSDTPYTGGIINTFTYGNWELSANLTFNLGGHVRTSPSYSNVSYNRGRNTNKDILDRWTPENPNGTMPALISDMVRVDEYYWYDTRSDLYNNLDIWVKKLNYFRLQSLRLGYRIPKNLTDKIGVSSASLGAEARNLAVFGSSYKNYMDPESMGNLYAAPVPKSFIFSLNVSF